MLDKRCKYALGATVYLSWGIYVVYPEMPSPFVLSRIQKARHRRYH
jgi:hypothetical protein